MNSSAGPPAPLSAAAEDSQPDSAVQTPVTSSSDSSVSPRWILARRVSRRTTDLLAIAVVAFGLFNLSDRISGWWSTDPDSLRPGGDSEMVLSKSLTWSALESPIDLALGSRNVVVWRQEFAGDPEVAERTLIEACRKRAVAADRELDAPSEAEQQLLSSLKSREADVTDGNIEIHLIRFPQLTAVAVDHDDPDARVRAWSILLPWIDDRWMIIGFHGTSGRRDAGALPWELPDGCRPIVSLSSKDSGRFVCFEGAGTRARWQAHFDSELPGMRTIPWQRSDDSAVARYVDEQHAGVRTQVDVHLQQKDGRIRGTLMTMILSNSQDSQEKP